MLYIVQLHLQIQSAVGLSWVFKQGGRVVATHLKPRQLHKKCWKTDWVVYQVKLRAS